MSEIFDKIFKLMEESFPKEEYRDYKEQKKLLCKPEYSIITKMDENNNLLGFISSWKTDEFNFIEHFAISPSMRGKGIGSKMLKDFIKNSTRPIVLEVELPSSEMNVRRIKFYEKLGFVLNHFKYYQMPLRKNYQPIEMYIMSYPKSLMTEEFESIRNSIYKTIYSID